MDLGKIKLFNLMQSNLSYLSDRQGVLAQNIANSNTPGYESKDIKRPDFASFMQASNASSASALTTTNPGHITGTKLAGTMGRIGTATSSETTPTGNKVVLEDEAMKMAQTGIEYQETTNLYRKMMEMIKTAIGNV